MSVQNPYDNLNDLLGFEPEVLGQNPFSDVYTGPVSDPMDDLVTGGGPDQYTPSSSPAPPPPPPAPAPTGGGGGGGEETPPPLPPPVVVRRDIPPPIQKFPVPEPTKVGEDPMSEGINDALLKIITGGLDPRTDALRFEQIREAMYRAQRSQMSDARAQLADRNLLSVPGAPQGAEIDALTRIQENIAPTFAAGIRGSLLDEADLKQERLLSALQMGTERQGMLAEIALGALDRNMAWNRFLAEHGLNRTVVMEAIRAGRIDDVQDIIKAFMSGTGIAAGGFTA